MKAANVKHHSLQPQHTEVKIQKPDSGKRMSQLKHQNLKNAYMIHQIVKPKSLEEQAIIYDNWKKVGQIENAHKNWLKTTQTCEDIPHQSIAGLATQMTITKANDQKETKINQIGQLSRFITGQVREVKEGKMNYADIVPQLTISATAKVNKSIQRNKATQIMPNDEDCDAAGNENFWNE